ncbi:MAG: Mov34/MPN/PAD-1 family protein [Candidatus Thorarchaeota archaeon]|jgi:PRTRC genetic system protein A
MFNIYLHDSEKLPEDDICYIVAKDGVYLKKKMGVLESIAKVDKISILNEIKSTASLNIPMIPAPMFAKVVEFFKAVHEKHRAEAVALLFYNQNTENFKIVIPKQEVSMAKCEYDRNIQIRDYTLLGDIHSHGNMSAFHSPTDDKDEYTDNDGLHITVGYVASDNVGVSLSITANGTRFVGEPEDYIDKLKKIEEIQTQSYRKVYKYINGKLIEVESEPYKSKYYTPRYFINIPVSQKTFNRNWLKKVKYVVPTFNKGNWKNIQNRVDKQGWAEFWQAYYAHIGNPLVNKNPLELDQKVISEQAKSFDNDNDYDLDDDDFNPCCECVFRDTKIDWALEQYTEPDDDEVENPINNFIPDDTVFMAADDGTGSDKEKFGEQHIENIVKEQHESPEFLYGQVFEDGHRAGEKIPKPDEIPENLKNKPIAWLRKYLKG